MNTALTSFGAVAGSVITFAFGIWPQSLTILLVAMAIDYITGVTAAIKEKQGLSSVIGGWGLAKKGVTLFVILLAHQIDLLLGSGNMTMGGAIFFYLANELLSVVENCGRIGLPVPERISQVIEVLRSRKQDKE